MEYEPLIVAIIQQAIKDYLKTDDEKVVNEIERFILSDWFQLLTALDPVYLLKLLRQKKSRREKAIAAR